MQQGEREALYLKRGVAGGCYCQWKNCWRIVSGNAALLVVASSSLDWFEGGWFKFQCSGAWLRWGAATYTYFIWHVTSKPFFSCDGDIPFWEEHYEMAPAKLDLGLPTQKNLPCLKYDLVQYEIVFLEQNLQSPAGAVEWSVHSAGRQVQSHLYSREESAE
jgi:hypothetical protein